MKARAAALALAVLVALAPAARAADAPPESRYYAPCIDRGPVRLHTGRIKIEAISTEARPEGVYYVLGATAGETQGRDGLIRWENLDGVDVWSSSGGSRTNQGAALGLLVGIGVALLATDPSGGFGDMFYPLTVIACAAPFALVGAFIGSRHEGENHGHWVPCRSIWYPYGTNASVTPSEPRPSPDAAAASASP